MTLDPARDARSVAATATADAAAAEAETPAAADGRRRIAAFDPGRNIGYAVVDGAGRLQRRAIVQLDEVAALPLPDGAEVVVGAGTGRRELRRALGARGLSVVEVDERDTTLLARDLWRRAHPPRGLGRLLPRGLRAPPGPIDDYAAWAIALRYLGASG